MSETLDRLKALNEKLEAKLTQKKRQSSPRKEQPTIFDTPEPRADRTEREIPSQKVPPRREKKVSADTSISKAESVESTTEASEVRRLTQILLHHLKINSRQEPVRAKNIERLAELYLGLDIAKKAPDIRDLFIYKAMNISGIGLKEEDFGEIREGKYVQVIAITYEPDKNGKKKAKNISLGYFGKAESLEADRKNQVIEFVLRWRYEKAFQNLEHYRHLLEKVRPKDSLF
ncbi:hypothetical protein [Nitratifractor sp.]